MPINEQMKAAFIDRVTDRINKDGDVQCFQERCQPGTDWELGEVGVVKGASYSRENGLGRIADGLVVPVLCRSCKGLIKYYDELPEAAA